MSIRNIDKGFIAQNETPNTCTGAQLNFSGAYSQTCNATFNKYGSFITLVFGTMIFN